MEGHRKGEKCRAIFGECKIPTVTSLFTFGILCYMKKNVELIHNLDIHEHNTGRNGDLHVQPCNTRVYEKCNKHGYKIP
jgi:hypothetical protein